jgi:hypothetical protein
MSTPASPWQAFRREHAGEGLSQRRLSEMYRSQASAMPSPARRSTSDEKPHLRRRLNLMIYGIAADEPRLLDVVTSVSLDLGVMADLGKLYISACDVVSETWAVALYVDAHPRHRLIHISKRDGEVRIRQSRLEDAYERVRDRVREFVREAYDPKADNALVLGGHGSVYRRGSAYTPVGFLSDGSHDELRVSDLASDLEEVLTSSAEAYNLPHPEPLSFVALDSCCLSTLENVRALSGAAKLVLSFQDEAPWNGFVSTRTLEVCCDLPLSTWRERLEAGMRVYVHDSRSQEEPSSVTLASTEGAEELWALFRSLPRPPRGRTPASKDLRAYYRNLLSSREDRQSLATIEAAFSCVVLAHYTPENGIRRDERNGLSCFV